MVQYCKLKELSFLVYGLGLSGRSVINFLKRNGIKKFKVWDDNKKNEYKKYRPKNLIHTFNQVDYIILSPGISLLKNKKLNKFKNIDWIIAPAEKLPIKDNSFDFYTISFGLRNAKNLNQALDLGLKNNQFGKENKLHGCIEILEKLNIKKENAAYIGDDNIDIPAMEYCGWSFTVSDAVKPVLNSARTILQSKG